MMVIYVSVKYEFDWTNRFFESEMKMWTDRPMDRQLDKKRTNRHNFANLISKLNFYCVITLSNGQLLYRSARPVPPNARKRRPVYNTDRTGQ